MQILTLDTGKITLCDPAAAQAGWAAVMRWRAIAMAPWAWLGLLRTVERQDLVDVIGDERISKRRRRRLRGKGRRDG